MNWLRWFGTDFGGNIAQWAGAVGTIAAVFSALLLWRLDDRAKRQDQARRVMFWFQHNASGDNYKVRNVSDGPISVPHLYLRPPTRMEALVGLLKRHRLGKHSDRIAFNVAFEQPSRSHLLEKDCEAIGDGSYLNAYDKAHLLVATAVFSDTRGALWAVNIWTGKVSGRRAAFREMERYQELLRDPKVRERILAPRQPLKPLFGQEKDPHDGGDQAGGTQATS